MKTPLRFLLGLTLMAMAATSAFAAYQTLTEPWIAVPKDFPADARKEIDAVLRRPDCKFLSGSNLNSFTTLNYGGDTKALNLFLGALSECPGVTVSVSFTSKPVDSQCDWSVSHEAFPMRFNVRVNLKSANIQLENLVIPEAKGPATTAEKPAAQAAQPQNRPAYLAAGSTRNRSQ